MLVSHLIQEESETGATRCPLAQQPILDGGYLNRQQECQCICDIFLKMAEETRSWQMILPLLPANFGLAAFTNRCWHIHRSQNSSVCLFGVSNTQTCGVESSELRCVSVLSFAVYAGLSHVIRLGFKCLFGWSLRRKLSTFLPAALFCPWRWYKLWVLLSSGLVLYVKVPNIPSSLTQQGIVLVTAAQLTSEPAMTEKWPWAQPAHCCVKLAGSWMWWNSFYPNEACAEGGNLLVQTHRSPLLPIEHLLPGAREAAPPLRGGMTRQTRTASALLRGAEASPQDGAGAECCCRMFSCLFRPPLQPAAEVHVEDAISAAVSESMFISEAFPKKILSFPSFVLAQLLWKGKMKNKQNSFSESSGANCNTVQRFSRSSGLTGAGASGGDQAAFTERLQLNLFSFSPLTLCQCFQSQLA